MEPRIQGAIGGIDCQDGSRSISDVRFTGRDAGTEGRGRWMLSQSEALEIARAGADYEYIVDEHGAVELSNGWYFPLRLPEGVEPSIGGPHGLAVNKRNGEVLHFGSGWSAERDLRAYEAGMTRFIFDICIRQINDRESTLDFLDAMRITVVEPEVDGETTWRIPRRLERDELESALSELPYTFLNVDVYHRFEEIEAARAGNFCVIELQAPDDSNSETVTE